MQGNKFEEFYEYSSLKKDRASYANSLRVEGDRLIQGGGSPAWAKEKTTWEETYKKINLPPQDTETVGTWEDLSDSSYRAMRIVTPTHIFEIATSKNGKEFKGAFAAT